MRAPGDRLLSEVTALERARMPLIVLSALLAAGSGLLLPSALATAVDASIAGTRSWPAILWLLALGAAQIGADVAGGILTVRATSSATAWLRRTVSRHFLALGAKSGFVHGDAISRLTGDAVAAGAVVSIIVQLASASVISCGAITMLAVLDWRLALVFAGSVPLALLLARSHLRLTADDVLTYQQVSGEISARLLDATAGLRTIAASGTADREAARVLEPLPRLGSAGSGMWRTQARMVWRAALLLPAVEVTVLVAAGFGVLGGRLSVGDLLAALGYVALGMTMVSQIPLLTTLSRARSGATRLAEVLDSPVPRHGTRALPPGPGTIELRGVGLRGALQHVDLTVLAGTTLAVVGRSGAGKSALAEVLGGLVEPDEGEVLLDGVPIASVRQEELRAAFGYAFERPSLLGETVSDAVGYGAWSGPAAVRAACRTAQVHDLVVRLPDGYHTPLTETPLSGGEAQRVGLARALARGPRVLVLDDATASLDTVTESLVDTSISDTLPGRTRIVVTHRVAVARRAGVVAWLDRGRLRAVGPHDALWAEPDYRAIFTDDVLVPAEER